MKSKVISFGRERGRRMNERVTIQVDLPEWLLHVIQYRVAEANLDATTDDDRVDVNDVIEWCLVAPITMREVPLIEKALPGTAAALSTWLNTAVYEPPPG